MALVHVEQAIPPTKPSPATPAAASASASRKNANESREPAAIRHHPTAARSQPSTTSAPPMAVTHGRERHENFPVASRLLPRAVRGDLLAIYRFARLVDDLGDEGDATTAQRLAWLDWADAELDRAVAGHAAHPVFRELGHTIDHHHLSIEPFRRLIEANRLDQTLTDHATLDQLLAYCRLSAAPVGEMVLGVFGAATPQRLRWSEAVCTGLQLIEHCQDVAEDAGRGRVYLPAEDRERFGVRRTDLDAPHAGTALRSLLALEVGRAKALLASGVPLAADLPRGPRFAVAGFTAGGLAACDSVAAVDFDVLGHRCKPSRLGVLLHTMAVLRRPAGLWPANAVGVETGGRS